MYITEKVDTKVNGTTSDLVNHCWNSRKQKYTKTASFNFCRLMAIQFLPAEYIPAQFEEMKAAGPPPTTNRLLAYYRAQWLENRVCPVAFWNAFNRTIRTNNDVEGWHHLFFNIVTNQSSLNMYKLIHLLHVEARNVNIQVSFLSNGALLRHHRKQIQKGTSCDHRLLAATHRRKYVSQISLEKVCPSQRTNVNCNCDNNE